MWSVLKQTTTASARGGRRSAGGGADEEERARSDVSKGLDGGEKARAGIRYSGLMMQREQASGGPKICKKTGGSNE